MTAITGVSRTNNNNYSVLAQDVYNEDLNKAQGTNVSKGDVELFIHYETIPKAETISESIKRVEMNLGFNMDVIVYIFIAIVIGCAVFIISKKSDNH